MWQVTFEVVWDDGSVPSSDKADRGPTVSWQEELRKLDEELASGRLSADDYRVRRDQVLSSAVTHGDAAGQQQAPQAGYQQGQQYQAQQGQQSPQQSRQDQPNNSADSTQIIAPVSPPQGIPQGSSETTQIVSGQDNSAERTQSVPYWQTQPPQFPPAGQRPPSSPPAGFPQSGPQPMPQQPWNAPDADLSPPWGGAEFPPMAPPGSPEWVKQGPEVFEDRPRGGRGGKIALIVIVVALVIGGLGVGGFFLFKKNGDQQAQPTTSQAPAPPPKPLSPDEILLSKIPPQSGKPDQRSGLIPTNDLAGLGIMDSGEVSILSTRSVPEVAWRGSKREPDNDGPGNENLSVMVIPLPNASTADDLVDQLRRYQVSKGYVLIPGQLADIPTKVVFHKTPDRTPVSYRGTWISGNNLIRIDATQGDTGDEAALSGAYQRSVKSMLQNFPITG
jgi:hypothetical protein